MRTSLLCVSLLFGWVGCGDDASGPDPDAGPAGDTGPGEMDGGPGEDDAGPASDDAGPSEEDAGPPPPCVVDADCDDGDACTDDVCDSAAGCASTFADADGDGAAPVERGACGTDCDDTDPAVSAAPNWYVDCDGDGFAASPDGARPALCDAPSPLMGCAGWTSRVPAGAANTDCDDGVADVRPGGTEIPGNAVDENCDGAVDCHLDADGDGRRSDAVVASVDLDCADPGEALATDPLDCDDSNAAVYAGATEVAGDAVDLDENCDGSVTCFANADDDSHRVDVVIISPDADCLDPGEARASLPSGDCNDTSASIRPGATEDPGDAAGADENCDGTITCFADADGDRYRTSTAISSADADCADPGEALASVPAGDCNDTSTAVNPGNLEVPGDATDLDEDCNGTVVCYANADGDGYRTASTITSADPDCVDPGEARASLPGLDCDDTSAAVFPGATEVPGDAGNRDENCDGAVTCYRDADSDGYRIATVISSSDADCSDAGEAFASVPAGDCNDTNAAVSPGDPEVAGDAGDLDENCDGIVSCYVDADADGYRTTATIASTDADCADTGEARASRPSGDCNDTNPSVSPGDAEVVGDPADLDEDCSGVPSCYVDGDRDGYRTTRQDVSLDADCSDPGELRASAPSGDCDDRVATINPGAVEVAGDAANADENCDTRIACYSDIDNDAYRTSITGLSPDADCADSGEAYASDMAGDCNDTNASISPGDPEIPGDAADADENCDGSVGCYTDADNDGWRLTTSFTSADADCADSNEGRAADGIDCNDASAAINPAAAEVAGDDVDENCDGRASCYTDADNDGARLTTTFTSTDTDCADAGEGRTADPLDCADTDASRYPGALELCDTVDQDCNGLVRNGCPSATETIAAAVFGASHGGTGGAVLTSTCAAGEAVVGFDIYTGAYGAWVNGIRRICRPVRITETAGAPEYDYDLDWDPAGAEVLGPLYGTSAGTLSSVRCSTDHVVSRISGRSGALVDQLSISCSHYDFNRSGSSWVPNVSSYLIYGPFGGAGGVAWGPDYCADAAVTRGFRVSTATCGTGTCIESIAIGCGDLGYTPQ